MKKANKITVIVIAAVLVPLAVLIAVFSFVKNSDGFNTGAQIYQAQITKNGTYSPFISESKGSKAVVSDANHADKYERFLDDYYSMSSFSVMRGIMEGKWFPKAKLDEVVDAEKIAGLKAEGEQFLVTLDYPTGSPQKAEVKVKKGTDDDPNSVKIVDTVYKEGEKVTFEFTTIVLVVEENQFINDLTLYAFVKADLEEYEFVAYKIILKANQIKFYQTCKDIVG